MENSSRSAMAGLELLRVACGVYPVYLSLNAREIHRIWPENQPGLQTEIALVSGRRNYSGVLQVKAQKKGSEGS